MNNLDLFTASELKNAGIQLAIQHAENKHEGWADEALNHLADFVRTRRTPFMCEEVREYAEKDRKSTRLNSSHVLRSRMPSSA